MNVTLTGAGELEDILARLFLNDVDDVIDRDHPDQTAGRVHDGGRNQAIFLEPQRDLFLIHLDRDQRLFPLHDVGHADGARCAQHPAEMAGADRAVLRINDEDFPEISRQILIFAQIIDDLPDCPMLGHSNQLALHQAAGGFFRVRERLFNGRAIVGCQCTENGALVVLLHVLDNGDGVIGIEFSGDVGHLLGRQIVD